MNFWVLLYRGAWIILAILAVVLVISIYLPQYGELKEAERKQASIEADIRDQEEILQLLKMKQERLMSDPRFLEKIVREEFGMAKEGESVIKFIEDQPRTAPAR